MLVLLGEVIPDRNISHTGLILFPRYSYPEKLSMVIQALPRTPFLKRKNLMFTSSSKGKVNQEATNRHAFGSHAPAMDTNYNKDQSSTNPQQNGALDNKKAQVIPVVEEFPVISREVVETGKVRIHKTVSEENTVVNLPVINESYHIERVPVNQVQDTPPPSVRYEGDVMIIPVTKEFTVVQKRYEIIEELRITRQVTETPMMQEISLLKESIQVERTRTGNDTTERF